MGKIRAGYDDGPLALAQWIKRKLANHHPMSAQEGQQMLANHVAKKLGGAILHKERNAVSYVLKSGRAFMITVEETKWQKLDELPVENIEK